MNPRSAQAHFGASYRERQGLVRERANLKVMRDLTRALNKIRKAYVRRMRFLTKSIRAALFPAMDAFSEQAKVATRAIKAFVDALTSEVPE